METRFQSLCVCFQVFLAVRKYSAMYVFRFLPAPGPSHLFAEESGELPSARVGRTVGGRFALDV